MESRGDGGHRPGEDRRHLRQKNGKIYREMGDRSNKGGVGKQGVR